MPRSGEAPRPRIRARGPVVVIGGANMDIKCRIAGATAMGSSNPGRVTRSPGGVARNIAENLARLRLPVALIGAIGRDEAGRRLIAETASAGVDMRHVFRSAAPTGSYTAILDAHGGLFVAVNAMAILAELTPAALARRRRLIEGARLVAADCNLPTETLAWLIGTTAAAGVPLVLETVSSPKVARLRRLLSPRRPLLALFTNEAEMAALAGRSATSAQALVAGAKALHGRGVRIVVIGLGRRGLLVSERHGEGTRWQRVPAPEAAIVEVTGAGDAAVAGTLYGLLAGQDASRAVLYGQAAAALTLASDRSVSGELNARLLERKVRRLTS